AAAAAIIRTHIDQYTRKCFKRGSLRWTEFPRSTPAGSGCRASRGHVMDESYSAELEGRGDLFHIPEPEKTGLGLGLGFGLGAGLALRDQREQLPQLVNRRIGLDLQAMLDVRRHRGAAHRRDEVDGAHAGALGAVDVDVEVVADEH